MRLLELPERMLCWPVKTLFKPVIMLVFGVVVGGKRGLLFTTAGGDMGDLVG